MNCQERSGLRDTGSLDARVGGIVVQAVESVGFEEVLTCYLADSRRSDDSWTIANLERANKAFGAWVHGRIPISEIQGIVLPFHVGGCDRHSDLPQKIHLVPPGGLTVWQAHQRLNGMRAKYQRLAPHCYRRISSATELAAGDPGPFLFSHEPLLVGSTYRGLTAFHGRMTHLDGLHRLLGLMAAKRRPDSIDAFVAVESAAIGS